MLSKIKKLHLTQGEADAALCLVIMHLNSDSQVITEPRRIGSFLSRPPWCYPEVHNEGVAHLSLFYSAPSSQTRFPA